MLPAASSSVSKCCITAIETRIKTIRTRESPEPAFQFPTWVNCWSMIFPIRRTFEPPKKSLMTNVVRAGTNTMVMPDTMPGIVSGSTMVFIPALTTFVISALLGGNKVLLVGNIIEQEFTAAYDWQLGSALSMVLMVFIILNILLEAFTENGETGKQAKKGARP